MSYEQAMKHSRNHRKDRFFQQCSGPLHHEPVKTYDPDKIMLATFEKIKQLAEQDKISFPFRLEMRGTSYITTDKNLNIANDPSVIHSMSELEQFEKDYVI